MKNSKKWIGIFSIVFMCVLLIYGGVFWKNHRENKELSLIYIPKVVDGTNDFWSSLISGTEMAAKEYNVELEIMAPANELDVQRQMELLEEAIDKNPDALLVSPSSFTELTDVLEKAKKQGIPVVFVDSYTEEALQDFTVATDNLEAGRMLGEYARDIVKEDTQIAIVGHVQGVSTAVEREQGFREGLGEKAANIVEVVFCDSSYEKAYTLMKELMEKYPDLGLIAGLNEYSSVGAARAVKEAGAEDTIKVVGIDSSQEAIQMMEQGVFQGLVVQKAFKMGYISVRETVRMLQGEKVDKSIDSGCELVTLENMYTSEIEKLIFPFVTSKK